MNGKLPLISGKDFCKILKLLGFEMINAKGSHVRFKHKDGRRTVVPIHANEQLGRGLLRQILNKIDLSREEYLELVEKV
jgi:predicted RNA binding protein YcfA (HicA-like mRNA interferase family)